MERLGLKGGQWAGLAPKDEKPILPGISDVQAAGQKYLGIQPRSGGLVTAGEFAPAVLAAAPAVKEGAAALASVAAGPAAKLAKVALGVPSRPVEEIAQAFEKRGYKLEPGQLKADDPYHSPGFMGNKVANQTLANKEASTVTGKTATANGIDQKFLDERFKTLGDQYDKIYASKPEWLIDQTAKQQMSDLLSQETAAVPGQVRPVTKALEKYIGRGTDIGGVVPSKDLARTVSELKRIARTASDGNDRYAARKQSKSWTTIWPAIIPKSALALKELNPNIAPRLRCKT